MRVLLTTAARAPWSRGLLDEIRAVAARDAVGKHVLVESPAVADIILFVDAHQQLGDWRMSTLRAHPYVREYRHKAFVYDETDVPRDVLPGVYVSMPRRRFDPRRHRACSYYRVKNDTRGGRDVEPDLLFSFQGRRTQGVRGAVLALQAANAVVADTSRYDFFSHDPPIHDKISVLYREIMARSKFVICPRGTGTSSFRLYEALACGRVPVIVSDEWVAPRGIDWESCSIRIAERRVADIPQLLASIEPAWPQMSVQAGRAYDEWFAPDQWFHRVVEECAAIPAGTRRVKRQGLTASYWRAGLRHWRASAS